LKLRIIKLFLGISLAFVLGGCSIVGSVLNPYEDDFKCSKKTQFGKCASTPEIYSEIDPKYKIEGSATVLVGPGDSCPGCKPVSSEVAIIGSTPQLQTYTIGGTAGESAYREASLAKVAKLLKDPVTPVVVPPTVMRILILPRKGDDGELDMAQFTFIMTDKPRWAMGDYLSALSEE